MRTPQTETHRDQPVLRGDAISNEEGELAESDTVG